MKNTIKATIDSNIKNVNQTFSDFRFEEQDVYSHWLAQTYYYVSHSGPLLAKAAAAFKQEKIKASFEEHTQEEGWHNMLAQNDLKKLTGRPATEFEELPATQRMYNEMYHAIEAEGPSAMLGYAFALEFIAVHYCPSWSQRVCDSYGKGFDSFIAEHGELDQEHTVTMFELLDELSDEEKVIVNKWTINTFKNYESIYHDINEQIKGQNVA